MCDNHCKFLDISGISSTDASRAPIVTIDTQNVVPPSNTSDEHSSNYISCIHFFMDVVITTCISSFQTICSKWNVPFFPCSVIEACVYNVHM